jgi:hypothetical protein
MDTEEEHLRHALLAVSPDGRRDIATAAALSPFLAILGVQDDNLVVRRFAPECLLVIFSNQHSRDAALRIGSVPVGQARLLL